MDHLLKRQNSWNEKERDDKEAEMKILKDFIKQRRPHCIVVGMISHKNSLKAHHINLWTNKSQV